MDPLAFQQSVLPSGATAVWQDRRDVEYVVLGVFVRTGSINDPVGKDGLAHLFEHLPFEGTAMFPTNLSLTSAAERYGGSINAGTSMDMTVFYITMPKSRSDEAWTILSEMVFRPALRPADIAGQVEDIVNEIASFANDVPTRRNIDRENAHMFGPQFARKARVLGWPSSLRRLRLADVTDFHRRYYVPSNMVFLAVGNLSRFLPDWPTFLDQHVPVGERQQPTTWPRCPVTPASRPTSWVTLRRDDLVPRLTIGARIHHRPDESQQELRKLQRTCGLVLRLLSGGQSSLIFQRIRERSNLAYDGTAELSNLAPNAVTWDYSATTRNMGDVAELLDALGEILAHPQRISTTEIETARQSLFGAWDLEDYTPTTSFMWAMRFLSEGHPIPTREAWRTQLAAIRPYDVRSLIARDLHPRRWVAVCYQPASG